MRIGVGAGEVAALQPGGVREHWERVVAGPPLLQLTRALDAANPNEVVISLEAFTLVQDVCHGSHTCGVAARS